MGDVLPFHHGWLGHPVQDEPYTQPEHLRMALADLGTTFIKLGQALSTRPDFLPPEYVTELAKLQAAAPSVPFEQICDIVCAELGEQPKELFAAFDPQPLASASIGQAYAAVTKDGQAVVVKVQRPGVAEQVEKDLEILSEMAEWATLHTAFGRDFDLPALVDEFAFTLRNELDYRMEAHNAERFQQSFAGDSGIHVPRVHSGLTSSRVLTIERMAGIKIDDVAALEEAGIDRCALAENAVRLLLRETFEFRFFHADPHPGNFFVEPDGSIALIDYGMVGSLDERVQLSLLRIGMAVARQDSDRLADELYSLGVTGGRGQRNALKRDLDHLLGRYAGRSLQDLAAAQLTSEVMVIARRRRLHLPAELVMLFRVTAMSEGLGTRLDPNFRLLEFATPYFRQFWLDRHSPTALAKRVAQSTLDATELGMDLPRRGARLISQLERGDLAFDVRHEGLGEFTRQLQRMVNRLALSILLAAMIVGLGLLMVVYHPPGWERIGGWLFGLGFLFALAFGAWLMWNIWRSGRR